VSIKKFISDVKEFLELDTLKKSSKKKSIKALLRNLESRKETISKKLEKKPSKSLKEELSIIQLQIAKGEKLLEKLNQESKTKKEKK